MKKYILLAGMLYSISISSFGQGFNIGFHAGYGLGTARQVLLVNSTPNTFESVKVSLGQGLNLGADLNLMFSENVGADLGFSYLIGSEFESSDVSNSTTRTSTLKGNMLRITPGIKVSAGETKNVCPYGRFGLILGVAGKIKEVETISGQGNLSTNEYEYTEGTSIGWYGAFGLAFKLADNIRFTTELITYNQSYGPGQRENTERSGGGSLDPIITYVDEGNNATNNTAIRLYYPFSSVGLNAGILIGL